MLIPLTPELRLNLRPALLSGTIFGGGYTPPTGNPPASSIPALTLTLLVPSLAEGTAIPTEWTARITSDIPAPVGGVSVQWSLTGTGATPADADDFGGTFPAGTATIPEGATFVDVKFSDSADADVEPYEGFRVSLFGPLGATIAGATADGVIENDDFPPPAAVTFESIQTEGWSVVYSADGPALPEASAPVASYIPPPTIIGDAVPMLRQGFDANGNPTVYPVTMRTTIRRKVNPLVASYEPRIAALTDYIYAGDGLTGAVNVSGLTSPKPVVKWACEDRRVVGDTLYAAVVAAHRDARLGKIVRSVRFIVTNIDTGLSVTVVVSGPTLTTHTSWRRNCPVWQANIDISSLGAGRLKLDCEVYPWFGDSSSVFRSADVPAASFWLCRTLWFRRDVMKATQPPIAVVKYGGAGTVEGVTYGTPASSGRVSRDPVEARAYPFSTYGEAVTALLGTTYANLTGQDLGGCEIYLAGLPGAIDPFNDVANRATSGFSLTIRRDPLLSRDAAYVQKLAGVARQMSGMDTNLTANKIRFVGLKFGRVGGGVLRNHASTSTAAQVDYWLIDCDLNNTGGGELVGSNGGGGVWFWGTRVTNDSGAMLTARTGANNTRFGNYSLGSTFTAETINGTQDNNVELGTHIASEFIGYNKASTSPGRGGDSQLMHWHSSYMRSGQATNAFFAFDALTDSAWVNVLVEQQFSDSRVFRIAADKATGSTNNVLMLHLTVASRPGGGMNVFYDETPGLLRTHLLNSCKGSIVASMAFKGGEFIKDLAENPDPAIAAPNSERVQHVGHYPHGHGVGHAYNFLAMTTGFNRPYIGIGSLGKQTRADSQNEDDEIIDPMFVNNQTQGSVIGDYRPAAGSPLIGQIPEAYTSHDLEGRPRPADDDTIGALLAA